MSVVQTSATTLASAIEYESALVARDLARQVPPVDASTAVNDVSEGSFDDAFVVVNGDRIVGLITRRLLSEKLFSRYGHALFGHKPIAILAQEDALRVNASTALDLVMTYALARPMQNAYDDVVVVDDEDGRYVGLLSVKRLLQHQMHSLVVARESRESAEQRARALEEHADLTSRFLATITHELRAPVNTILGLAELVGAQLERGRPERAMAHVTTMRTTAAHLRGLVDDVLDQAKLDANMVSVDLERFDLDSMVREIADATRPLVLGKPVIVEVRTSEATMQVTSDRLKVRQILMNFASNAAKHTDQGHVVFAITADAEATTITVEDTGPGIAESALAMLFRPFVQVDDPATRRHGGTGLGLANARRFADLLGARIAVESVVGHGSRFSLLLPYQEPKEVP